MTLKDAINEMNSDVKVLIFGVVKLNDEDYTTAYSLCMSKQSLLSKVNQFETFRVLHLKDDEHDEQFFRVQAKKYIHEQG